MKTDHLCQSCSIPLKKNPGGNGTEADGSLSTKYCDMCYKDGEFIQDMTVDEMQQFVEDVLVKEQRVPRFFARWMARVIPKLERWKTS